MTISMFLVAIAAVLVSCAGSRPGADVGPPTATTELARLGGTWVLVDGWLDGKKVDQADLNRSRITWTGNHISVTSPHLQVTGAPHLSAPTIIATITVDPATTPRRMDIVYTANPATPALAIYEWLGDDRYRICIDRRGQVRPSQFVPGACQSLHVWQRERK